MSPIRFLFSLVARLRTVDGPRLETDLAEEALQETTEALSACSISAVEVETALDRYTRTWTEVLADGVVTLKERAKLARLMLTLKRQAHTTTTKLKELS